MPIVIRTARPSDADPVAELIAQLGGSAEGTEDAARDRGCVEAELTSAAHRLDAHRFYLNAGYEDRPHRFRKRL